MASMTTSVVRSRGTFVIVFSAARSLGAMSLTTSTLGCCKRTRELSGVVVAVGAAVGMGVGVEDGVTEGTGVGVGVCVWWVHTSGCESA